MTYRSSAVCLLSFSMTLLAAPSLPLAASEQDTQTQGGGTGLRPPSGLTVTSPAVKGDIPTREYYLADCPEYDQVDPATMLLFATEEEAQRLGFHKAQNCP